MKRIQPLKAPNEIISFDDRRITYPKMGSVKYDGYRMMTNGAEMWAPSGKDLANLNLRGRFCAFLDWVRQNRLFVDGELYSPSVPFETFGGIIRSTYKQLPDDLDYYVFHMEPIDYVYKGGQSFAKVCGHMDIFRQHCIHDHVHIIPQIQLNTPSDAQSLFDHLITSGEEGLMLRCPHKGYKNGPRCTHKQDWLFKFKHYETFDAVIVGVQQARGLRDDAGAETNIYGLTERSRAADQLQPLPRIGSFKVYHNGKTFNITPGKGFNVPTRELWWEQYQSNPDHFLGKVVEGLYMPHGTSDKPRIGRLKRFRPDKTAAEVVGQVGLWEVGQRCTAENCGGSIVTNGTDSWCPKCGF